MATQMVETYEDGILVSTEAIDVPYAPTAQPVLVDPTALADAQAKIATATTVAALRSAVQAALDLLNPSA